MVTLTALLALSAIQVPRGEGVGTLVMGRHRADAVHREATAGVERLLHSFCPHLAMRGTPSRATQELAGHADLTMTQRYMHLTPAALDAAVRLLE
jgi:site-specific recombinase XerD